MKSIRDYVGMNEYNFSEAILRVLIAVVVIFFILGISSSIIFGTLIYYNHVDYMTSKGYVLVNKRLGSGLTANDVAEWTKQEDQKPTEDTKKEE